MGRSQEYRLFAARCLEIARATTDEQTKAATLQMAQVWSRLADEIASRSAAEIMFCEAAVCDGLERLTPGFAAQKTPLGEPGPHGQPFYLIDVRKSGSL